MKEKLIQSESLGKITLFFDPNLYLIESEEIKELAIVQKQLGRSTGYNLDRIAYGEFTLYYNPVYIKEDEFKIGIRKITEYIKSCRLAGWQPRFLFGENILY